MLSVTVRFFVTTSSAFSRFPHFDNKSAPSLTRFCDDDRGITKPAIRRLARRGGVKRISGLIYEACRFYLWAQMLSWWAQLTSPPAFQPRRKPAVSSRSSWRFVFHVFVLLIFETVAYLVPYRTSFATRSLTPNTPSARPSPLSTSSTLSRCVDTHSDSSVEWKFNEVFLFLSRLQRSGRSLYGVCPQLFDVLSVSSILTRLWFSLTLCSSVSKHLGTASSTPRRFAPRPPPLVYRSLCTPFIAQTLLYHCSCAPLCLARTVQLRLRRLLPRFLPSQSKLQSHFWA